MILFTDLRDKLHKFRKNKRGYYSVLVLGTLFLLSLPAELVFNDKPIVLRIDGRFFFPVFKQYTYRDLGGSMNLPVVSYRSAMFRNFCAGKEPVVNTAALFPEENTDFDPDALPDASAADAPPPEPLVVYREGKKREVWALWPPIPHSYKSSYTSDTLERQRLASPFARTVDGRRVPGAIEERHLLGTDQFGKDVLARLVYGFRISVAFGLALAVTSALLGCILGALQGFFGGVVDLAGQRMMEIWGALPQLMLLMILSDFLSRRGEFTEFQHVLMLFIIMNLTSWMGMAQHMRAQFLRERNRDYVRAARALGVSDVKIMFRHILPNSLVPIVTFLPFSVSAGIGALVGLDYLGFGLKYPAASLGELLSQGQQHLQAWWIMVPTFLTLTVLTILLVFVGDGVRNAFDPRYK